MKKFSEFSADEKRKMLQEAIMAMSKDEAMKNDMPQAYPWIRDLYSDRVIIEDGGELHECSYKIAADGTCTLGEMKRVKVAYEQFEELNDIEIFEAGTYRGKTYTEADLDKMVANFEKHKEAIKPVAVIGHSEDQKLLEDSGIPAAGWMTSLKKVGTKLVSSFKDVPKVIAELVKRKAYKRISSEIYNDYNGDGFTVRRVALLGGEIPEVKTLQDALALYADSPKGDTTWVSLDERTSKSVEGEPTPPAPAPRKESTDMDVIELAEKVSDLTDLVTKLTEAGKADKDKIAALEEANKKSAEKFTEVERSKKTDDIKRFVNDRLKEGRISPAIWGLGLEQFMASLDDNTVIRFGDGKRTRELTPLAFMKAIFMNIPKNTLVKLGEVASTGADPGVNDTGLTAADRLSEATKALMKATPTMKFNEAFTQAQKENPDLAAEYAADSAAS